jgi:xylulokinase
MDQIASAVGAGNIENGIVTEATGTALVVATTCNKFDF